MTASACPPITVRKTVFVFAILVVAASAVNLVATVLAAVLTQGMLAVLPMLLPAAGLIAGVVLGCMYRPLKAVEPSGSELQ